MKKILIVEDDFVTRKMISHRMELAGYCTYYASNGLNAIVFLKDNPDTDIIITDMQMPEMDGRELINKLSSDPETSSIPVIIVSGLIPLSKIKDLLENGAERFLPKPICFDDLIAYANYLTTNKDNSKKNSINLRAQAVYASFSYIACVSQEI